MQISVLKYLGVAIATVSLVSVSAQSDSEVSNNTLAMASTERSYDIDDIEGLFVEGERPTGADMELFEMERVYRWKETAARSFMSGQYEKAFPQLLLLARMGFKDAQARVSYIYLNGLGGQKKSNMEPIGWLGVASTGETRPVSTSIKGPLVGRPPCRRTEP